MRFCTAATLLIAGIGCGSAFVVYPFSPSQRAPAVDKATTKHAIFPCRPDQNPSLLSPFVAPLASTATDTTEEEEAGVVVERLPGSSVLVHIPVPGTATKAAFDKLYTELCGKVQIPGFRRGSKVPIPVLEQHMSSKGGRNALKVQAINELMNQLVEPTLKENSLEPIGQATLDVPAEELAKTFKPGESMMLDVRCDVWPEIKWLTKEENKKAYVGLEGEYTRKPFSQEKLDMALRDLKERYAKLEPIKDDSDYELQMGDACTVNMEGFMAVEEGGETKKGEPLPNAASGDNVEIIMGSGRYMEGLVEGLVDAKVGETRVVTVSFPDKLRDKSLAGKKAIFDVKILSASKRTVPEITDEFANQVKAGLTAETLNEELMKAIDLEDNKEFMPARNQALKDALSKRVDMDVPDSLVTNQAREKFALMLSDMRSNGVADDEIKKQISPENFNKYKEIVKDDIEKDFKVSMAIDEIGRMESITVEDYKVEEQMEAIKKDVKPGEDFDEKLVRAKVQTTLERQAVLDWLAEESDLKVKYTTSDADEGEFDPELMEKLAEETLQREEEMEVKESKDDEEEEAEEEGEEDGDDEPESVTESTASSEEKVEEESAIETTASSEEKVEEESAAPEEDVADAADKNDKEEAKAEKKEVDEEDEESKAARYAAMSLEDRAFAILSDLGTVGGTYDEDED